MRILITGFEPFGGQSINPSWEVARALDGLPLPLSQAQVRSIQLPCVFAQAAAALTRAVDELQPDIVLALGQDVDLSLLEKAPGIEIENGVVKVGPNMMTGRPGVFAGGDIVRGSATVILAMGDGKRIAGAIDDFLRAEPVPITMKSRPAGTHP